MKKTLPKVYANIIDKKIEIKEEKNIDKQIQTILNTKKYIYKIPVEIETEKETIITKIIGKNKNNIITIDNELIKIDTITNIKIKNE